MSTAYSQSYQIAKKSLINSLLCKTYTHVQASIHAWMHRLLRAENKHRAIGNDLTDGKDR